MRNLKPSVLIGAIAVIVILPAAFLYFFAFRAPQKTDGVESFTLPLRTETAAAFDKLQSQHFIRSEWMTKLLFHMRGGSTIEPGGYNIAKTMNAWQIAGILTKAPSMRWISIPEGLRKEQIAEIFQKQLGWTDEEKTHWITVDTAPDSDHVEGVYFPDTYLIPTDETPADTTKRLRAKFEENFVPYAAGAINQNIKWTTLLKVASLIQREAGGKDDMKIISGVIWNRLDANMGLQIDATVQYARGDTGNGFWAPITPQDKQIDSLYNTYKYAGLPPHPIDNPGLDAIDAALYPAKTQCLYYLHDSSGVIHCAKTYEEHQANIEKYLR